MEHPIIHICRAIPAEETELTGEFLDKLHLIFVATGIYQSKNRDECYKLIIECLPELGILAWKKDSSGKIFIKQDSIAKEVVKHYGY